MSYRAAIFIAAASIATAVSGISQAAPIAPLPAGVTTDAGNLTPVYYYRHHYRYYRHHYYHHYRHHYYHRHYHY
jgi:hypothetical protein